MKYLKKVHYIVLQNLCTDDFNGLKELAKQGLKQQAYYQEW